MNRPSIEYYINPNPLFDKTFDSFSYRGDIFDTNTGVHIPNETFTTLHVETEFQRTPVNIGHPLLTLHNNQSIN